MPRTGRRIVEIPKQGETGSARGHVWVLAATIAFRCEGLDPWAERTAVVKGHTDIEVGESYLLKRWRVVDTNSAEHGDYTVTSRHCVWCGKAIEGAKGGAA